MALGPLEIRERGLEHRRLALRDVVVGPDHRLAAGLEWMLAAHAAEVFSSASRRRRISSASTSMSRMRSPRLNDPSACDFNGLESKGNLPIFLP